MNGVQTLKSCVAEFIGTFALIFVGAGSVCANSYVMVGVDGSGPGSGAGILGVALAHGLVLAIMVSSTGHLSGGHINPAVTFSLLITDRIEGAKAAAYVAAQLLGASLGAFALSLAFPYEVWQSVHLGTPALGPGVSPAAGILIEAILTFFLVFAVYATAVDQRAPRGIYGFAIGLVLTMDILVGGGLTGAAMNPARAFGPALLSAEWLNHLVYWVGPLLGGAVAALIYHYLFLTEKQAAAV